MPDPRRAPAGPARARARPHVTRQPRTRPALSWRPRALLILCSQPGVPAGPINLGCEPGGVAGRIVSMPVPRTVAVVIDGPRALVIKRYLRSASARTCVMCADGGQLAGPCPGGHYAVLPGGGVKNGERARLPPCGSCGRRRRSRPGSTCCCGPAGTTVVPRPTSSSLMSAARPPCPAQRPSNTALATASSSGGQAQATSTTSTCTRPASAPS